MIGLTFDHARRLFFYSDIQKGKIYSVHMNGSNIRKVIDSEFEAVRIILLYYFIIAQLWCVFRRRLSGGFGLRGSVQ